MAGDLVNIKTNVTSIQEFYVFYKATKSLKTVSKHVKIDVDYYCLTVPVGPTSS
jgi:hypothetical protein